MKTKMLKILATILMVMFVVCSMSTFAFAGDIGSYDICFECCIAICTAKNTDGAQASHGGASFCRGSMFPAVERFVTKKHKKIL